MKLLAARLPGVTLAGSSLATDEGYSGIIEVSDIC